MAVAERPCVQLSFAHRLLLRQVSQARHYDLSRIGLNFEETFSMDWRFKQDQSDSVPNRFDMLKPKT